METFTYTCGCIIPTKNGIPNVHIFDVSLTCQKTWDMIRSGNTKMGFQIESDLISSYSKKLKPDHIDDLAALISIVRPGTLNVVVDGESLALKFCKRKNNEEPVTYLDECLKPYLSKTYGIIVYQEQVMRIAKDIAGLNLVEVEKIKGAISKKKADILASCRPMFVDGCDKVGKLSREKAEGLYDDIEKSARYSFCAAHAVSYAYEAYYSIWPKAHGIKEAFASWLYFSNFEQKPKEEIRSLVNHSLTMKVKITSPYFPDLEDHFYIKGEEVKFGLADIKGIGDSLMRKLKRVVSDVEDKIKLNVGGWSFYDFLIHFSGGVVKTSVEALIGSGALDYMGLSRSLMLDYFRKYKELTDSHLKWIENNYQNYQDFPSLMKGAARPRNQGGAAYNVISLETLIGICQRLDTPATSMDDTLSWLCDIEDKLLGIAISTNRIGELPEGIDVTSCSDFKRIDLRTYVLAVEILSAKTIKCKRGESAGQEMAFLTVKDQSGVMDDVAVFPSLYHETKPLLTQGNTVLLFGTKDEQRRSLKTQKISQL